MQVMYHTETYERNMGKHVITVSNVTPIFQDEEKSIIKRKTERRLYQVFSKYLSSVKDTL